LRLSGDGKLLRIFIGEADRYKHQALYNAIVLKARDLGLAGSTILRGVEGFGARSRMIHTTKLLELSDDMPIVIEIVDTEEKIEQFLSIVNDIISVGCGAMITIEKANVITYTHGKV
jgi:PII-like signaling protein